MKQFLTTVICTLLIPLGAMAQGKVTKGLVTDRNGEPIIGATVVEKGTKNATVTDFDGNFSLTAGSNATLTVSYVGFQSQDVKAGSNVKIVLDEMTNGLDEVVVIGYGTTRRKDITGSVASVNADKLNSVSSTSVNQMLQGRVAGMSAIQSSAQPGAGISINIRGAASPSGSNSPLYVIDGVPIQTGSTGERSMVLKGYDYMDGTDRDPLNSINPNDIESIEVLKDASAAAIYGASAANGVILVTTKTGKSGKPKVEWRSVVTTQQMKSYPERLGAKAFREQANLWTKEYYLYKNKMGAYGDNPVDLSGYTPVFADVNGYTADTDWLDEVSRPGYIIDQNLSVNGGVDKTKYYVSYNYYKNQGLLKRSDLERHTVRLNLNQEFSKVFKAGIKFTYSNVGANSTSVGTGGNSDNMIIRAIDYAPDIPVRDANGNYSKSYNQLLVNPVSYTDREDYTKTQRVFVAPSFELKLMDGLTLNGVGGYDTQTSNRKIFVPADKNSTSFSDGMASLGNATATNASVEGYLNYDKTFGDHHVSAVLGAGYYKTISDGFGLTTEDFFTNSFGYNNVGIASDINRRNINSTKAERTKLSQFFRANYSYKDRYMLTVTARRDGSSYFAENNKWGVFPSASVAWRISEESFMAGAADVVSNLKLRVGYGATGNENVLGTNSLSLYKSGYNYLFGSSMNTGLMLTQVENPNLKWETDYTLNIGIDYGFLNQRFNGSIEFFHRGVKDLLDYQVLPSNNAVGKVAANIGETKSQGFEFSLNSDNLTSSVLKWETSLNVSYFVANWVERNPEVTLAEYIGEKDAIDTIYGWETDGIITSKDEIPSYMPDAYVGNIKYKDQNGDGVLDSKDVKKLGNSTPRWMIGFGNTFTWKGFDLNFYFYSALGFKKAIGSYNSTTGRTNGQIPVASNLGNNGTAPSNTWATVATDVWNTQTGTGWMSGIATNPYDSSNPSGYSDFYLQNGDYIKLKNITLGYTLPQRVFQKSNFIRGARFFVDAQNLWTITSYEGFDPELSIGNPYPQAVSLSFGFNLNF